MCRENVYCLECELSGRKVHMYKYERLLFFSQFTILYFTMTHYTITAEKRSGQG